jgi:hypothetical protein
MGWFGTHKPEVVDEIILAAIKEVKTKHNVDKIGLTCVVHFFRRVLIVLGTAATAARARCMSDPRLLRHRFSWRSYGEITNASYGLNFGRLRRSSRPEGPRRRCYRPQPS